MRSSPAAAREEDEAGRGRGLLTGLWLLSLLAGLACASVFVVGILRDTHFEEADLAVDLGSDGGWRGVGFRVWGGGPYALWLTTLRQEPPYSEPEATAVESGAAAGEPPATTAAPDRPPVFSGRLEVRILNPDRQAVLERPYEGARLDHGAGGGMTWTRLADLALEGLPHRAWRLEARVAEGDPAFESGPELRSRLLLRGDRPDVGMGGLINYVMVIPAGLLLLLSLGLAVGLARRGGSHAPAWISGLSLAALATAFGL